QPYPSTPGNANHHLDVIELSNQHGSNFKLKSDVFFRMPDDEPRGTLQDDRRFLVNEAGFLSLTLLFRDQDPLLPNNREPVKRRSVGTHCRMKKDPEMPQECVSAMGKSINTGKVEIVEENELTTLPGKAWWILFCRGRNFDQSPFNSSQLFNIRLHKIASSDPSLLKPFPPSEIADGTKYVDFDFSSMQSTLGVYWDPIRDEFMVRSNILDQPFTKRGILGVVNTPYDVIGFMSPITLGGRLLQRQMIPTRDSLPNDLKPLGRDDSLPERFSREWDEWKRSINQLYLIKVPRPLRDKSLPCDSSQGLFVFTDSSQDAIGVVAHIKSSKGCCISTFFLERRIKGGSKTSQINS
ncbi:hypothetical protein TCAL_13069, partial [Tigriopus californicus]